MADVDNRLDREDGIRTMDALRTDYSEFEKQQLEDWLELCHEFLDGQNTPRNEGKGATFSVYGRLMKYATSKNNELASLRERAEKAEAERDAVKELAKRARVQLQATQINWQEECLYECNDLLTLAIGACPSCTWRGDVTLQDGKCPYCKTDWLKLEGA